MLFVLFFLLLLFLSSKSEKIRGVSIQKVLVIAFLIRVFALFLFHWSQSQDLRDFLNGGKSLLENPHEYTSLYFPFYNYVGFLFYKLRTIIPPLISIKFIFSLFDIGVVWLMYLISRNISISLVYALNPIPIITTTIHGQFDTAPLFFLLLGVYFFSKKREMVSSLALSFGVFTKTWPILFVLPLIRSAKRKWIFLFIALIPGLSIILHMFIFKTSLVDIITPIKNYRGLYGYWGISEIFKPIQFLIPENYLALQQVVRRMFFVIFILYSFTFTYKTQVEGITKLMLFFFIITPTFGGQWLTWLIPFVLIARLRFYRFFLFAAIVYLIVVFYADVYPLGRTMVWLRDLAAHLLGLVVWTNIILMFSNYFPHFRNLKIAPFVKLHKKNRKTQG